MGEHGEWSKYSNFGVVTNVPLILYVPGIEPVRKKVTQLVELLDLFPTLVEAAGLQSPQYCPKTTRASRNVLTCVEGD